jgi:glycosyltransferase involved in cell wall biosynthesis
MMRVAYVCADPGIPVFGSKGASIHVQEMCCAFLRLGVEVTVFSPRLEGEPPAGLAALRLRPLPALTGKAEERACGILASNRVLEAALDDAAFDLVYERHALFAHAAMEHAARRRLPSVLEVNAPLLDEQARHRGLALPEAAAASARRAFAAARVVTAVTPAAARYAEALGAARVEVVPNAVDPRRFPRREVAEGPFTVGFLGTLRPWHDVATLLEAFALLRASLVPEARLLIVGDGPERPTLEARVAALGLGAAVEFTGAVPARAVPEALARMHVGVAPYRGGEPFYFSPLKLYEYMAAGLPVVASRVGDLPDLVTGWRIGLACPPDDPAALASALARLAMAPAAARRMGEAARAEVLAHHTWDGVAARVLAWAGGPERVAS